MYYFIIANVCINFILKIFNKTLDFVYTICYNENVLSEVIRMEEKEIKRDYKKEAERDKQLNKTYIVKVPLYQAKALDEKLSNEKKTFASLVRDAIEKYLKKI